MPTDRSAATPGAGLGITVPRVMHPTRISARVKTAKEAAIRNKIAVDRFDCLMLPPSHRGAASG